MRRRTGPGAQEMRLPIAAAQAFPFPIKTVLKNLMTVIQAQVTDHVYSILANLARIGILPIRIVLATLHMYWRPRVAKFYQVPSLKPAHHHFDPKLWDGGQEARDCQGQE